MASYEQNKGLGEHIRFIFHRQKILFGPNVILFGPNVILFGPNVILFGPNVINLSRLEPKDLMRIEQFAPVLLS